MTMRAEKTMRAENLSTLAGLAGKSLASKKNSREDPPASRFVVDGHSLIAIAHPPGDEDSAPDSERHMLVGRITCAGTCYLIYDADLPAGSRDLARSAAEILTHRQLQIALLIGDGKCDKEIARQLGISGYTVREHIRRIFAKLNIGRRSAIVSCILREPANPLF